MNLDIMFNFTRVAEVKSLSKAAQEVCLSQSALSKQMIYLEDYFGLKLLNRNYTGVTLTSAGEIVLRTFQDMVQEFNSLKDKLSKSKYRTIGCSSCVSLYLHHIAQQRKIKHHIHIIENQCNIIREFKSGKLDIVFLESSTTLDNQLEDYYQIPAYSNYTYLVLPHKMKIENVTPSEYVIQNGMRYIGFSETGIIDKKITEQNIDKLLRSDLIKNSRNVSYLIDFLTNNKEYFTLIHCSEHSLTKFDGHFYKLEDVLLRNVIAYTRDKSNIKLIESIFMH